ncbi:MAG: imidazole glycerol phosphate synthase subunit HisH [Actinobacteria bacterium]|nr:imidazole glycerol phosphate synthase subunit HisH [Actinomycetota bacterium]
MIAILDYGMGNLRSVARAVERVGGKAEIAADPEAVARADALVVPGVGHFGACMLNLAHNGLDGAVRDFASSDRPVFGVCLGMQVLFERSEENAEEGIGLIPGRSRKLPATVKVPHMGWNTVEWIGTHPYVEGIPNGTRFYFVHSYAPDVVAGTTVGVTEYGRPFSAVVAHDNLFATQFHPEKSGEAGLALYEAFVKEVG